MTNVYLAGPTVFLPDAEAAFDTMKKILARYDLTGIAPVDNQVGLEQLPPGARRWQKPSIRRTSN